MKNNVLSIDYGTQSVRVSIINKSGDFLAFEQVKFDKPYISLKPGFVEQDPDYFVSCMQEAARRLVSKNPELIKTCAAISQTCFRDTPVFLDKDLKPLRNSIMWLDQRFALLKKKMPFIYQAAADIVGMHDVLEFNRKKTPAIWVQENEPEIREKVYKYAPISFYFTYKLIGKLTDCPGNAVGHYPINFKKGVWYHNKSFKGTIFNINDNLLPEISPHGENIGNITHECYLKTGLPEGLPFYTSGYDKACEAIGCGSFDDTSIHISYGTASTLALTTKKYCEPVAFLPAYPAIMKNNFNMEIQIYRGYWMLKWFSEQFATKENIEATIEKLAVEEILNNKILNINPGCDGLLLQPYWGPSLERPLAKGSIIGFYDVHTKEHVYRAIIEGICYALKEGYEKIIKRGHKKGKVKFITVSGGGSKSDAICQITSDIFNLPVLKTSNYESCSIGCALSTFLALKEFDNPQEATKSMVKYTKKFIPNPKNVAKYEYLYRNIYLKIYPKLKKVYSRLSDYLHKEIQ